ncbi:MAG: hypothetical protein JRE24_11155 [Deltaproteobacteria bacterium]|nr:hypothetical protein [Deltaproteobacteria bacterium]
MKTAVSLLVLLLLTTFLAGFTAAQELIIYPSKGQSQEQMEQDKFSCYSWAKQQTGFDPMEVPKATAPPPKQEAKKGGLLRGATRGAAVGVAAGAIAGDAGKGAAIGAASGGLIGGMRRRDQAGRQQQAEQQWAQEQSAQYTHRRNEYNRAYAACLEGKGYTVK